MRFVEGGDYVPLIRLLLKALSTTADIEAIVEVFKNVFLSKKTKVLFSCVLLFAIFIGMAPSTSNDDGRKMRVVVTDYNIGVSETQTDYLPYIPAQGITPDCINKTSICWIQCALKELGYYHGDIDGKWGPKTSSAVTQFKWDYAIDGAGIAVVDRHSIMKMLDAFLEFGNDLDALVPYCR